MYLDCFYVYVPAFMVGHLMHRLAGQDLDAALFQRRHARPGPSSGASGLVQPVDPTPSSPASGLRVVLQISDGAPLVGRDEINWRRAGAAKLSSMPLTVGACTVTVVPPNWPFQASGISHNQIMQPRPPPTPPRGIRTSLISSI